MRLFSITIIPSGEKFDCGASQNVLAAMNKSRCKSVASGCRRGGCGICRVEVIDGGYHTLRMSRNQISEDDEARVICLACRLIPESELVIKPIGFSKSRRSNRKWYNSKSSDRTLQAY